MNIKGVKTLTFLIDQDIKFVGEAIENKKNFDELTFNNYIIMMKDTLSKRIEGLKRFSSNDKLIAKYNKKVNNLLESL